MRMDGFNWTEQDPEHEEIDRERTRTRNQTATAARQEHSRREGVSRARRRAGRAGRASEGAARIYPGPDRSSLPHPSPKHDYATIAAFGLVHT
jgi:hypothetical protein